MVNSSKNNSSPFSWEKRRKYVKTPFEDDLANKILNIFDSSGGFFVVAGHRGVGKSSIIQYARYLNNASDRNNIVIEVPYNKNQKTFYRSLLTQLKLEINALYILKKDRIDREIKNLEKIVSKPNKPNHVHWNAVSTNLEELHGKIKDIKDFSEIPSKLINGIFDKIQPKRHCFTGKKAYQKNITLSKTDFDDIDRIKEDLRRLNIESKYLKSFFRTASSQLLYLDAEVSSTAKFIESTTNQLSINSSNSLDINATMNLSAIKLVANSKLSLESIDSSEVRDETSKEIKSIISDEVKFIQLTELLSDIAEKFKLTFIIEELDKLSNEDIEYAINSSKQIFLNSSTNIVIVTDIYKTIYLLEESDYITYNNILVVKSNSFEEYLYRKSRTGSKLSDSIFDELDLYFESKMINRNLLNKISSYSSSVNRGAFLYRVYNEYSPINRFPILYKEAVLTFIWEVIDLLAFSGKISQREIDEIIADKIRINEMSSRKFRIVLGLALNYIFELSEHENCIFSPGNNINFISYDKAISKLRAELTFCSSALMPIATYPKGGFKVKSNADLNKITILLFNWNPLNISGIYQKLIDSLLPSPPQVGNNIYVGDTSQINLKYFELARFLIATNNVLGVILFEPDFQDYTVSNGVVITYNSFGEYYYYSFLGYPAFQRYSPGRLEAFKKECGEIGVKVKDIDVKLQAATVDELEEYVSKNISDWIKQLSKDKFT